MDKGVARYGEKLMSYIIDHNPFMFKQKLKDVSRDEPFMKSLLKWIPDANDDHKNTLLMTAIKLNNREIFDILMQNKVMIEMINHQTEYGNTALHVACHYNNVWMVECILRNHGNPNILTKYKQSAAALAVKTFNDKTIEILKLLAKYNFKISQHINNYSSNDRTMFCEICKRGNLECVQYVLDVASQENGTIDFYAMDKYGRNLIEYAIRNKNGDNGSKIVEHLIEKIYYTDTYEHNILSFVNRFGNTPLHIAAQEDNVDVFEFLISKGAIDCHTSYNFLSMLPIHTACHHGSHKVLQFILNGKLYANNLNVGTKSKYGSLKSTPLCIAAKKGSIECVELLCREPSVDMLTFMKCASPFFWAISKKNNDIFKILFESLIKRQVATNVSRSRAQHWIQAIGTVIQVLSNDLSKRQQWINIRKTLAQFYSITIDKCNDSTTQPSTKRYIKKHHNSASKQYNLRRSLHKTKHFSYRRHKKIQRYFDKQAKHTIESKLNQSRCNNSHNLEFEFTDAKLFSNYNIKCICNNCGDTIKIFENCCDDHNICVYDFDSNEDLILTYSFHYCHECKIAICNNCVILQYLYKIIKYNKREIQLEPAKTQPKKFSNTMARQLFDECIYDNKENYKLLSKLCQDKNIIDFIVCCRTYKKTTSDILEFLINNTKLIDQENLVSLLDQKALFVVSSTYDLNFLNFLVKYEYPFENFINTRDCNRCTPLLVMCRTTNNSQHAAVFLNRFLEICDSGDECKIDFFAKCDHSKSKPPKNALRLAIECTNQVVFDVLMQNVYSSKRQDVIKMFQENTVNDHDDNCNESNDHDFKESISCCKTDFLLTLCGDDTRGYGKRSSRYISKFFETILTYCLEYGIEFFETYSNAGLNVLHMICRRNWIDCLVILKRTCDEYTYAIDWNSITNNRYKTTPLMIAIENGSVDCIQFLLNNIPNIDITNIKSGDTHKKQGKKGIEIRYPAMTALEHACYHGWDVKMLNLFLQILTKRSIKITAEMVENLINVACNGKVSDISRDWETIDHFLQVLHNTIKIDDDAVALQLIGHLTENVDVMLDLIQNKETEWHENESKLLNRFEHYQLTPFETDQLKIYKDYPTEGNWYKCKSLGVGSFGKVYLAIHKEYGFKAALKYIKVRTDGNSESTNKHKQSDTVSNTAAWPKKQQRMKSLIGEISALVQTNRPNIVNLLAFKLKASKSHLEAILALEYAHNGDLHGFLKKCDHLDENITRSILRPIVSALLYLHKRSLVHRDIKPENILLDFHYQPKISDFGLCIDGNLIDTYTGIAGTWKYMAPEAQQGTYSGASDVFSIGVLSWYMLIGKYGDKRFDKKPFKITPFLYRKSGTIEPVFDRLYQQIQKKEFSQYCKSVIDHLKQQKMQYRKLSSEFYKWFVKMVQFDPKDRPTHFEILDSTWMKKRKVYHEHLLRREMKRIDDGYMDGLIEYSETIDYDKLFETDEKTDSTEIYIDVNSSCIKHPFIIINEITSVESKINTDSSLDVLEEIKATFENKLGYCMHFVENDHDNQQDMNYGIDNNCVNRAIIGDNDTIYDRYSSSIAKNIGSKCDGLLFICICPQNKGTAEKYIDTKNGCLVLREIFEKFDNDCFNNKPKICIFNGLRPLNRQNDDESINTGTSRSSATSTSTSCARPADVLSFDHSIRFYCDDESEVLSLVNVLCDALALKEASLNNVINKSKQDKEEHGMKYTCIYENREF